METGHPEILVIDDDPTIRSLVSETLMSEGYTVASAASGDEADRHLDSSTFPIVLCDILLPDTNGLELMAKVKESNPDTFVILFTGHASADLAAEAIRQGASDFITKPFTPGDILEVVRRAESEQRISFSEITYRELRILHELTVANRITTDTKDVALQLFGDKTAESFSADSLRIYLKPPGSSAMEKAVDTGPAAGSDEVSWYFLASRILESGSDALLDGSEAGGGNESFMGTVIPTDQNSLGVIIACRESGRDRFKARDLKLLGLYAAQLGNQLQNMRMTDELRNNNRELERINVITSGFSLSLDISSSVSAVAGGLRDFLGADAIGLFASVENGSPYNYLLRDQAIPEGTVVSHMRRLITAEKGPEISARSLSRLRSETYHGIRDIRKDLQPDIRLVDLSEYGKIEGCLVTGTWSSFTDRTRDRFVPIILRHAASALCNSLQHRENQSNYLETITAMAQAVDMKDKYTHFHSRNVTAYALALADRLGVTGEARNELWNAALLHDIGKIGIPENILNKPGKLTDEEAEIIRTHPSKGCSILKPIKAFKGLLPAVRHHHERFDGNGYPDRLAGTNIPVAARMLTVADSFDAMTSNRTYRKSPGLDFAIGQLEENSGTQFDPDMVAAWSEMVRIRPHLDILKAYGTEVAPEHVFIRS